MTFLRGAEDAQIASADADRGLSRRADRCHQLLIQLACEHHHRHISRLFIGDAQSVDEGGLASKLLQGPAQCRAAAVHDHQLVLLLA